MGGIAKILGWTIAGAVLVKLVDSGNTSGIIDSITKGWSNIISSITGSGNPASGGINLQPQAAPGGQIPTLGQTLP